LKDHRAKTSVLESPAEAQECSRPRILALCEVGQNSAAAAYSLSTLLQVAGARVDGRQYRDNDHIAADMYDGVVSYGSSLPRVSYGPHLHIRASGFFCPERYLKRESVPLRRYDHDGISSLYTAAESDDPGLTRSGDLGLTLSLDLVASTFVFLTGYHEVVTSGSLDKRGRRLADESFQLRLDLVDRPIVNEYARYLRSILQDQSAGLRFRRPDWAGSKYALALTRDIDTDHKAADLSLRRIISLAARGKFQTVTHSLQHGFGRRRDHRKDPYDNIAAITAWEEKNGVRSSLYVMPSSLIGDAGYKLTDLARKWNLSGLQERGWEIGFHPGYRTYASGAAFEEEKAAFDEVLGGTAAGGRQHGLRFLAPYTWRHWEDSGFRYDSTLGFPEREGFKCGICVPFRPFDILENRVMNLWELPLTLMDSTLDYYRKLDAGRARTSITRLLDQIREHDGVFVLLWHNTCFGQQNAGYLHDELENLVRTAIDDGALVGPASGTLDAWEGWVGA